MKVMYQIDFVATFVLPNGKVSISAAAALVEI